MGVYRVEAPFVFETTTKQTIAAPFDAYIQSVSVEPGDHVEKGKTILGKLEISEMRLELASLKAEKLGLDKQAAAAMRDGKTADAQIFQARAEKVNAKINLVKERIQHGTLVAPITGRIISEDLRQKIGAPVETGSVLFEIAPIDSLRAELYVPEDRITDIKKGGTGELASVGRPDRKISFIIEKIHPVAEVVKQRNIFKVRAKLTDQQDWIRPGMEGLAKITIGKKPYIWIGSRGLVNWLRMKFWL
jgi:multidrug resistance efflux pump